MSKVINIKPFLSEKSYASAKLSKFTFEVSGKINKIELTKMIEGKYNVNVENVSVIKIRGKARRIGNTREFRITPSRVKAIVSLKKGQTIEGFTVN
jgi:large subunit ribosomal protein L23